MLALVIDDSRTMRTIIGSYLRQVGMDVIEAADGMQGLDQLEQNPDVDVVLVDWNMPVMNGIDFIKAMRAEYGRDRIRVLMVTSETESEQVARAIQAGADEYLMKPFSREILLAKLDLLDILED